MGRREVSLPEIESLESLDVWELDSVEVEEGLSALIFSSVVHGVGGTGHVPGGNSGAKRLHGLGT